MSRTYNQKTSSALGLAASRACPKEEEEYRGMSQKGAVEFREAWVACQRANTQAEAGYPTTSLRLPVSQGRARLACLACLALEAQEQGIGAGDDAE